MYGAQTFPALIRELQGELGGEFGRPRAPRRSDGWRLRALEIARRRIAAPQDFIDWAKRDRHWSFTLAEVMRESCSKSSELAALLLVAILEELEDEREVLTQLDAQLDTDELATEPAAAVAAYAE